MKQNEYIIELLQGYLVSDHLAGYLESFIKPEDRVLDMTIPEIHKTKEYVVEIANNRAGTRQQYDAFEVTKICKELEDDGWIYFAKQIRLFKKAEEFFIAIDDAQGNDLSFNERFYRYDPEWEQNERHFEDVENLRELEQEGYFVKM